ncbi:hypothetical protein FOZ63_016709 [Perkinsus olseni]|uniref:Uncharacterized protein n=2 Tax=Perkinsus olseni TaxID=32597 RepID=A0A7J6P060_PEROL|nr:hypothetical protein FOZ60_001556 [Perkinsus olseni]KAF4757318.1 hypothetical protein FOZ63_016709 [Perkinsus olseni]
MFEMERGEPKPAEVGSEHQRVRTASTTTEGVSREGERPRTRQLSREKITTRRARTAEAGTRGGWGGKEDRDRAMTAESGERCKSIRARVDSQRHRTAEKTSVRRSLRTAAADIHAAVSPTASGLKLGVARAEADLQVLSLQHEESHKILSRVRTHHSFPRRVELFRDGFLPVLTDLRETIADMRFETSTDLSAAAADVQDLQGQYMATSLLLDEVEKKVEELEETIGWS